MILLECEMYYCEDIASDQCEMFYGEDIASDQSGTLPRTAEFYKKNWKKLTAESYIQKLCW